MNLLPLGITLGLIAVIVLPILIFTTLGRFTSSFTGPMMFSYCGGFTLFEFFIGFLIFKTQKAKLKELWEKFTGTPSL